jgi:hypothetical protein
MVTKEKIEKFKDVTQQITTLIRNCSQSQRDSVLFDKWRLKDLVAHLSNWMAHDIECLTALKENREPYWEPDVDEFNAKGIEARKELDWNVVYEEFINLIQRLINTYETMPAGLWEKPIWTKYKDQTPCKFLEDNISHWQNEHLEDIKQKLTL